MDNLTTWERFGMYATIIEALNNYQPEAPEDVQAKKLALELAQAGKDKAYDDFWVNDADKIGR